MKGFENGDKVPESRFGPEANVYAEISRELQGIIRGMTDIDGISRKAVFKRMIMGPEAASEAPELVSFFEQITAVEDKYGRERVAELSAFYEHGNE